MRPYLEAYFNDQYCETTFFPDILLYGIDAIQNLTLQNYPTNIEAIFEMMTGLNYSSIKSQPMIMIPFVGYYA